MKVIPLNVCLVGQFCQVPLQPLLLIVYGFSVPFRATFPDFDIGDVARGSGTLSNGFINGSC
jgi:hypothetical protein